MFGSFRDLAFLGVAAGTGVALDPDAQSYITAVETVDGQALEAGVRDAINAFVVGCKADGIWTAIKACCIMAGARTRLGAMVPLVGPAPTSFNFVDGDYNRKTGLVGNGSTKYLNSNRAGNADPQNNAHLAVQVTAIASGDPGAAPYYLSSGAAGTGAKGLFRSYAGLLLDHGVLPTANTVTATGGSTPANGFLGYSRTGASAFVFRNEGVNTSGTTASQTPTPDNTFVLARNNRSNVAERYSNARLAFYSIGESLDLALLDARVTDLINAFGAAIP
jgi:hypothetical protein